LNEAEAEFEKGDVVTHEELLKQIRGWEKEILFNIKAGRLR
jgi:predicted transcriptional regulator